MPESLFPYPRTLCACGRVTLIAEREIHVRATRGAGPPLIVLPGWNHVACGQCGHDWGPFAWSEPWRFCVIEEDAVPLALVKWPCGHTWRRTHDKVPLWRDA